MRTLAVEVTSEQSAIVYVRVPQHWDPATLQQALTPQVLQDAIETGRPLWHQTGELVATYVTPAPPRVQADYFFADEGEREAA